jgi:hypothetical protein
LLIPVADVPYDVNLGTIRKLTTTVEWQWTLAGSVPSQVLNAFSTASQVYVNGVAVGPAHWRLNPPDYPTPITISAEVPMPRGQWNTVTMSVSTPLAVYNATPQTIFEIPVSPFVLIADTFRSPSCSNCHSLDSSSAISSFHISRGAWSAPNPNAKAGDPTVCNGCHAPAIGTGNWFSPPYAFNMNWSQMSTKSMCVAVINHLGDMASFDNHITFDPRFNWSMGSGALPDGKTEPSPSPYYSFLFADLAHEMGFDWTISTDTLCRNLEWVP